MKLIQKLLITVTAVAAPMFSPSIQANPQAQDVPDRNTEISVNVHDTKIPVVVDRSHNIISEITVTSPEADWTRQTPRQKHVLDKVVFAVQNIGCKAVRNIKLMYTGTHSALQGKTRSFVMKEYWKSIGGGQMIFCDPGFAVEVSRVEKVKADKDGKIEVTLPCSRELFGGKDFFYVSMEIDGKEAGDLSRDFNAGITAIYIDGKEEKIDRAGLPKHHPAVNVRTTRDDGVHSYRIPGLVTTKKGTLIAVYDVRYNSSFDLQSHIDIGVSRSTDKGRTWEKMRIAMDMGEWRGLPQAQNGVGDPAVLVDESTGDIIISALWTTGIGNHRAWGNIRQGLSPEETGQIVLARSTDDGCTWSAPYNITSQIKRPEWFLTLQGPGRGITMQDGTLVFAIQHRGEDKMPSAGIMYSKDNGLTWHTHNSAAMNTTEAQVAEIEPGVLMLNMRNNDKTGRIVATTADLGKTWTIHPSTGLLREPVCMGSLLNVRAEDNITGRDILFFSNPDHTKLRKNITIKASVDKGMTWPEEYRYLLDEEEGWGYSCMTLIDRETIGILYESSVGHMTFQAVKITDIIGSEELKEHVLWYDRPAARWEETLPLGNGRLGMMPDGGIANERIVLNEISMWSGCETDYANSDAAESLPEIRSLLQQGKNDEAQEVMYKRFVPKKETDGGTYGTYQILANLEIGHRGIDTEKISGYRRSLNLKDASASTEFFSGNTGYRRKYYISRDKDVMVIELTSERKGGISFDTSLSRDDNSRTAGNKNTLPAQDGNAPYTQGEKCSLSVTEEGWLRLAGELDSGKPGTPGVRYCAYAAVITDGGTVVSGPALAENDETALNRTRNGNDETAPDKTNESGTRNTQTIPNRTRNRNTETAAKGTRNGNTETAPDRTKIAEPSYNIKVDGADRAWIVITAETSYFGNADFDADSKKRIAALCRKGNPGKVMAAIEENSIRAHRELYDRASLHLPSDSPASLLPTDRRIQAYSDGSSDNALAALYYNFGRYLLISSTRPGSLPPNLQGLWANTIQTPWNGDYHTNINVQMNHWIAEQGNLSELHLPLTDLILKMVPSGEKTARDFYGPDAKGWVQHMMTNVWNYTAPGEKPSWGATNTGGAWLCSHLWEHYEYTLDRKYLEKVYPAMSGAARFFLSTMITDDKYGYLVTAPSSSPENEFIMPGSGKKVSVCLGPTMDSQIVREIFTNTISAAEILGEQSPFTDSLRTALGRLAPMKISPEGYLMEWLEDYREADIHHRHVSHLYGLHPGRQITPEKTPELAEACRKTLNRRGDEATGWSRAWKLNFWARLGDGDRALKLLKSLLSPALDKNGSGRRRSGTFPNLLCSHPPFQIDGNFGGAAGIGEMLLQSHDGEIKLLPALPEEWKEGAFEGFIVRGGAAISLKWKNGRVSYVLIDQDADAKVKLTVEGTSFEVSGRKELYF